MNILRNNPYRLLGVYSNSPTKERLANHNRMKAFLKVGKTVSFPLDLPQYLSAIQRTEASVMDAEAQLTLPKDQLLYAQFWFVKATHLDEVAFNHLFAGEIDKAEEIWQKKDTASSLQNRIVCALMREDYRSAITCAETLYENPLYSNQFVSAILGTDGNADIGSLAFRFLDELCDEVGANKLLPFITDDAWESHVEEKAVKSLVDSIQDAIAIAKKSKGKEAEARLNAGEALRENTRGAFQQLKGFLSATDLQYQMIADKLGLEILQCGIDYFNGSEEPEAAHKAMSLQKYAQSIVVGQMAKDRCKENVDILQKIIDDLPPFEVYAEDKAIQKILASFVVQPDLMSYSIKLIKECAPYVVAIKEKIGKRHPYYLNISTRIVDNAIANVVSEVNEAQLSEDFETLKKALIEAWRTQLYMDKFDLEPEYRDGRYKQNRDVLYKIIHDCSGFESEKLSALYRYGCGWCNGLNVDDVDLRTDDEFYISCASIASFKAYIEKFPSGKHVEEARSKIELLYFRSAKTLLDYRHFISNFPNSSLVKNAQEAIDKILKEQEKQKQEKQEKAISSCTTTDAVISLYKKEKTAQIDVEKCASKAYELSKSESDYRKVISVFGRESLWGKKAELKIAELERKRKGETRKTILAVSIFLLILVCIPLCIYFMWGFGGLSKTCYFLALLFGLIVGGCIMSEGSGCGFGIIAGIIALGLGFCGHFFEDISSEKEKNTPEEQMPYQVDSIAVTDDYENDLYSDTTALENSSETENSQAANDYETYIDNQLPTGSKPYKKYYQTRTGRNHLDFKTSDNDYVIIVRDFDTDKVVNHIYIRANDNGRLYLPDGTYYVYFYGGKGWNPNMKEGNVKGGFVSGGLVQKDGPIVLTNSYGEYTLYPIQNGNLQLQDASEGEAFQ